MRIGYVVPAIILAGILGAGASWAAVQAQTKRVQATHDEEIAERDQRIADLERLVEQQRRRIQSLNERASPFLRAAAQSRVSMSKGNLKNLATALESFFVDNGRYPSSLGELVPLYIPQNPFDPCTNSPYDYHPEEQPAEDYRLTVAFPPGNVCAGVVPGLSYTPRNALQEIP